MVIAEAKGIGKWYGEECVLLQCSLEIRAGESYGLVGINGAGKSTLMKILLGLQMAEEGSVLLFGEKPQTDRRYLTRIGSMIERPVFYEHLNAVENLKMHLAYMQRSGNISEILHQTGLFSVRNKPVSTYSLGMKQRLGLARAMIHHPDLLVLDEPFNGMDTFVFGGLADGRRGRYDFSYLGRTGGTSECAKLCVLHYLCDNGNRKCDHQGLWKRESIPSFFLSCSKKKDLSGQMSVGRCVDFASRNYRNWSTAWSVVCSVMGNRDSASDDFRQILDGGTCSRNERSICGGSHVYLQQNSK
ncbi:ABC transporter ATP-binding protein [Sellimonas catena]|uniref:ABC transporter domain-containing protein n=1 Tax=Sellimonas catena TaxID=2994035 RepID=A0A9W6CE68_9FIRM|nr:ATP-binding cassette domain-containing protein [Sellimonas catena]GLG89667.1 hypothetical protein Selli2_10940 [Sellimonas catena]